MRPVALHLEGFGAFREPVDLAFDGVDFFALVGPTGAGKSTVIDALCFALYGSVPRYGDERLVGRVVSLGRLEAKVSLTFDIGAQRFRATRVVRVRNGKATTPEAVLERLIRGDATELLAGSAREMKPAVERLLGLPFSHFTRCVVLPQGEFARFLHDEPAKRRELLSRLLDLQVYERVGQLARERVAEIDGAIALQEQQLADVAFATPDAAEATEARVEALRALYREVDAARDDVVRLTAQVTEHAQRLEQLRALAGALDGVTVPPELAELAAPVAATRTDAERARAAHREAADLLTRLDADMEALPDPAPLRRARDAHVALATLDAERDRAAAAADDATTAHDEAQAAAVRAEQALEEARGAVDATRDAHAAHTLTARLTAGEPCPVCDQPVARVPKRRKPAALSSVERALAAATKEAVAARKRAADRASAQGAARATLDQIEAQAAELRAAIAAHAERDDVEAALARVERVTAEHGAARRLEQETRTQSEQHAARARDVESRRQQWATALAKARDAFVRAGLEPPAITADLDADWSAFDDWAAARAAEQRAALATTTVAAGDARRARDERVRGVVVEARELGVAGDGDGIDALRDAVVLAGQDAAAAHKEIVNALDTAAKLRDQLAEARADHGVAALLARVMRSNRFEKWLLAETLEILVRDASATMFALSSGQFSLRYSDDDEFVVVDHRNAEETRSVRTLSGGETFQASLALALALSNQLAELSAAGGAKLDAIFLDEGFGSLDAETLEVVAGTIETLGTTGRMVGIVTHVPALAERVPVRYRVSGSDQGATVEREDA